MADIINDLPPHQRGHRDALLQAMGDARLFGRIADDLGIDFKVENATWLWPGTSVAAEFLMGAGTAAVECLAKWAYSTSVRLLQQSMESAWQHAFEHRPADFWLPILS